MQTGDERTQAGQWVHCSALAVHAIAWCKSLKPSNYLFKMQWAYGWQRTLPATCKPSGMRLSQTHPTDVGGANCVMNQARLRTLKFNITLTPEHMDAW